MKKPVGQTDKARRNVRTPADKNATERKRVEKALHQSEERYRTTMMSVGDGVIATTTEGKVEQLNPVAEALTGWRQEEARGKLLEEVFRIINEETRQTVENPILRVMREGLAAGPADHSVLIAKDGTEHPITGSGAPIRDAKGEITGVVLVFRDQTLERAAQRALAESERKFRETIKYLDQAYYSVTLDGRLIDHNQAYNQVLGIDITRDLKGQKTPDFWQDPEDRKQYLNELKAHGFIRNYLVNAKKINDEKIVVLMNSHLKKDEKGGLVRIEGTFTDFTERKRAEKELHAANQQLAASNRQLELSMERLADAQAIARLGSWEFDAAKDVITGSDEFYRLFGVGHDQLRTYQAFLDLLHPDDREHVGRDVQESLIKKALYDTEYRVRMPDGDHRYIHARGQIFADDAGKPVRMVGTCLDVTERKRAEEALAESEKKHRALFESMSEGIVYEDHSGKIISANPAAERLLGLSLDQMQGLTSLDPRWKAIHVDGSPFPGETHSLNVAAKTGEPATGEVMGIYNPKSGAYVWLSVNSTPEFLPGAKKPFRAFAVFSDITKRKRAEEALQETKDKLELRVLERTRELTRSKHILDEAGRLARVGGWELDLKNNVLSFSDVVKQIHEVDPEYQPTLEAAIKFYAPEAVPVISEAVRRAIEYGESYDVELQLITAKQNRIWVRAIGQAYRDNGKIVKIGGVFQDITARKLAEIETRKKSEQLQLLSTELEIIIDSIPGLVFYKNAENRFIRVNKYVADAYKKTKKEMEGASLYDLHSREEAQAYLDDDLKVIRSGKPRLNYDEGWPTETGFRWVNTSKIPYFDEKGEAIGIIGVSMDVTQRKLAENEIREKSEQLQRQNWLQGGLNKLNDRMVRMVGEKNIVMLADEIIACVAEHIGAQVGALFLAVNGQLRLTGRYAYRKHEGVPDVFSLGEGLVGQAAAEKKPIQLNDVPEGYVLVGSGLGQAIPRNILAVPFLLNQEVKGVIEIASLEPFSDLLREFLNLAADSIGIAVQATQSRELMKELLEESQRLTEELQTQQEELKTANEELEEQTWRLKESEEKLKTQQEELEVTNEELEEKNDLLDQQKREVELARKAVEEKAAEVALASKYKSEFLANMSHELRTPLNSLLLLAQGLVKNKEGNLTADQKESARIIYAGGSDLLNLINEILDLSRIEAGRMDLRLGPVRVSDLAEGVRASFGHMVKEKGIDLEVVVSKEAPAKIASDHKRVEQVIRNIMANAIRFTERGSVTVTFGIPAPGTDLSRSGISANECLAIAVKDTGIGIAPEHQKIIFEAFQQADGGTARKYGGTGLGLSISREIVSLLGGEIQLESEPDKGSVFTVYLPTKAERLRKPDLGTRTEDVRRSQASVQSQIPDDRDSLTGSDAVILVIEDDPKFAGVLRGKCHEKKFKCLIATTGEAGLELAAKHLPAAVILDIHLPGMDGWSVLSVLKEDIRTRHIPVHVVSVESASTESLRRGAVGHASKPLDQERLDEIFRTLGRVSTRTPKRLLVVEDDPKIRRETVRLIGNGDVKVDEAGTGAEAMEGLRSNRYDCVVLDLGLPDMDGNELLAKLEREGVALPPVIVHTARDFTRDEEESLRERARSIVIKDVRSQERLLDEVSLFLHRVVSKMPEKKRKIIQDLHDTDELLRGKKVLIVDDDMRTTFAVSRILSERGMDPLKAENGERALRLLEAHPDVALVLMDIMMPVMDGYEAMKRIRAREGFYKLPIIALTAKAMPEDREKCLAAGANDYMPKPVDEGRLISMIRIWLCR